MKISYYELLGMIKEGNIPQKIEVKFSTLSYSRTYYASYDINEFSNYFLLEAEDGDEKYEVYLSNCFLESDMFDKCITILDDDFEDIEELNLDTDELLKNVVITQQDYVIEGKINQLIKNQKKIINILKTK